MEPLTSPISHLPNEILIQILDTFSTCALLQLATVDHRFLALVQRVHYARLLAATRLQDDELILECYHPSAKLTTPYQFCEYLGTNGLEDAVRDPDLATLNGLYSRFRPVLGRDDQRPRARHPTKSVLSGAEPALEEIPSHDVSLDYGESFTQLCTVTSLVKNGPRRGLFLSAVNISDGLIRVWRKWLATAAAATEEQRQQRAGSEREDKSILWADATKNIGMRFRVVEKADMRAPVLVEEGEDPPVAYKLEYEELLVRTNLLLLNREKAEAQKVTHAGKAVVIASV